MAGSLTFPTIFLLPTHFGVDELPEIESQIPTLTYDINEAKVVLGKITKKPRAILELRSRKLLTDEVKPNLPDHNESRVNGDDALETVSTESQRPAKRRRLSPLAHHNPAGGDSTASDTESSFTEETQKDPKYHLKVLPAEKPIQETLEIASGVDDSIVQVVRLAWYTDSLAKGKVLPVDDYVVYTGRKKAPVSDRPVPNAEGILKRAREDGTGSQPASRGWPKHGPSSQHPRSSQPKRPHLVQESTSEHERATRLPPIPDYLHTEYSCQRPTPFDSPNSDFIEQRKNVRTLRTLEGDEVGIRAYSISIAALAAYPYLLSSPSGKFAPFLHMYKSFNLTCYSEVARLPGCGPKIVELYKQWKEYGALEDVEQAASDSRMKVLLLFYEVWGVGAKTANDFYNRGWRDLDDIVEFGWDSITRVQQIGVKYYEELLENIPRAEVEEIGRIILEHANKIRKGFQMVVVGGYRRGKAASGDVDVVLSHPDHSATEFFVNDIVKSLEKTRYLTHTLTLSAKNSERGQAPVAWKGDDRKAGSGFDTLDKALVVWQNPHWDEAIASKNPNPHRRIDIISEYLRRSVGFYWTTKVLTMSSQSVPGEQQVVPW